MKLLQSDREMWADIAALCANLENTATQGEASNPHQSEQKMSEYNKVLYCMFAFGLHSLGLKDN